MATSIKSMVTQMETAFLSIFCDAAMQVANLADSQVFLLFESSEGCRRIGGDDSMLADFQAGRLFPRSTDQLFEKAGKGVPLRTSVRPGTFFDQKASVERREAENTDEFPMNIVNREATAIRRKRRQNLDAAATTGDVKIKRLKKGNESRNIDDGSESDYDENNGLELQILPLNISNEEDFMLYHDVDDDSVEDGARDGVSYSRKNALSAEKRRNDDDDVNDDVDWSSKLLRKDKPVTDREWNDGDGDCSAVDGPTVSLEDSGPGVKGQHLKKSLVARSDQFEQSGSRTERRRCGLCPASNSRTYTLKSYHKHKAGKHDRKLVCPQCQRGFPSDYYLSRHCCRVRPNQKEPSAKSEGIAVDKS